MESRREEAIAQALMKLVNITDVTKFPALVLQYVGSYTYAKAAVAAGGDLTITADNVDGVTTVHPTVGYAAGAATALGIVDLSTPHASINTFGELADHLNAEADLRCYLLVPRNLSTDNKLDEVAAASIATTNGLTLFLDEDAAADEVYFSITGQKFTCRPTRGWTTKNVGWITDEFCENMISFLSVMNHVAGTMTFYACDDINKVDAPMALSKAHTLAVDTELTLGNSDPVDPYLKAPRGMRLCVELKGGAAALSSMNLLCMGETKNVSGRPVYGENYTGCV